MSGVQANALPEISETHALEAIEAIYREQYPRLVALLVRTTGNRAEAEEIAAEAIQRYAAHSVWRGQHENPQAWLYRTAVNLGLNALRAGARRRRHEEAASRETIRQAPAANPLDQVLRDERQAQVRAVLARLKPTQTRILLLRHEGLRHRDIAAALGLKPDAVRQAVARALSAFESEYRKLHGEK